MAVKLSDLGGRSEEYLENKVDVTEYANIDPAKDVDDEGVEKNKTGLKNIMIEGIKIGVDSYSDTPLAPLAENLGLFDVKKKNTEEDNKIKTNLEKSGLPSDPLNVGISKIIKAKIENNTTLDTSSEEIDAMTIKAMKEKEIDAAKDMVSHIVKILETNNKLADQKLIGLKTKLGRAESQKKYLEGIIKAYEDAEKKGGFQEVGIGSVKARLEDEEKIINDLKTELQQYEDGQGEVSEEITEDTLPDEETEDTLTDEEESEEVTEEAAAEVIILTGTMGDGVNTFTMSMTIDLKTGVVAGMVYFRMSFEFEDVVVPIESDVPISGSMNLETRGINAKVGEEEELILTGTLSADGDRASGTGSEGMVWSVSR